MRLENCWKCNTRQNELGKLGSGDQMSGESEIEIMEGLQGG